MNRVTRLRESVSPFDLNQANKAAAGDKWSESINEQQVARVWRCTKCGHQCETREEGITYEPSATELAEEFLARLVVE